MLRQQVTLDSIIYSLQHFGGASVYWRELSKHLRANDVVDIFEINSNKYERLFRPNINTPIMHSSHFRIAANKNVKSVVTIYDLIYEKGYSGSGIAARVNTFERKRAVEHADAIICISESTKIDLLNMYPNLTKNKLVKVIHLATNMGSVGESLNSVEDNLVASHDVLFVGGRSFYKNFYNAVLGFYQSGIFRNGRRLVCTGQIFSQTERDLIGSLNLSEYVVSLGQVSEARLAQLYANANCLLYPSLYEGFGIPIIESMSLGCPVLIANAAASTEIAGDAALIFNGNSPACIARALNDVQSPSIRLRLRTDGYVRAKLFSWERCAAEHEAIYTAL
jgi:mannosyltransferase